MTPEQLEMEAAAIEAMHTEDYTYPPLQFTVMSRSELAALHADLKTQRSINDLLRLENETLGTNLAALRARVGELEAMLIRGSDAVYDLIGALADATGKTRAELEIAFLGEEA